MAAADEHRDLQRRVERAVVPPVSQVAEAMTDRLGDRLFVRGAQSGEIAAGDDTTSAAIARSGCSSSGPNSIPSDSSPMYSGVIDDSRSRLASPAIGVERGREARDHLGRVVKSLLGVLLQRSLNDRAITAAARPTNRDRPSGAS